MNTARPLHFAKFIPPPYAGVEAHVDTLLRALLPEVQGTLIAGESPSGTLQHDAPYRILSARCYGKLVANLPLSPGVLHQARLEIESGRCNLLHQHAPNPWGDLAALTIGRKVPVVMTWHSDIVKQRALLAVYRPIQRRAIERADRIVVFTPRHYESSEQLHQTDVSKKIVKIPIGIDFARLAPEHADPAVGAEIAQFSQGRPVALTVGRHVYYKGYEFLLSAMARLKSDAVLVMIGSGALSTDLKRQAQELDVADRVLFLGEVDNARLAGAMHACDFFCLPSIAPSEAFGIASAEAMSCGKPTIVCNLGNGVNYLNREGETSLAVMPRDVAALADAIDTLALDAALRTRMGGQAQRWVHEEFGIEAMKLGMLKLYESLS